MDWGFVFLMFALKIPLLALCGLVWWAIKQTTDEEELPVEGGGAPRPVRPHPLQTSSKINVRPLSSQSFRTCAG